MRILGQCNTVYQFLVLTCIRQFVYPDDEFDIIVSDVMNDSVGIRDRADRSGLFTGVYLQNRKGLTFSKIKKLFMSNKTIATAVTGEITRILDNKKYDLLLMANVDFSNICLYYSALKKNKSARLSFYEDGLSTYSRHFEKLYKNNSKGILSIYSRRFLLGKSQTLFCFSDRYFTWKPEQKLRVIPNLTHLSDECVSSINDIFGYRDSCFPDDARTIFFEEGYFGDGKGINDIEIIRLCIERYGKTGFYVKTHPRNKVNRFLSENISTLPTTSIPWELFVLNNSNKVSNVNLITIASGALFNTNLLFDCRPVCVSCIKLVNDERYLFEHIPEVQKLMVNDFNNIVYF